MYESINLFFSRERVRKLKCLFIYILSIDIITFGKSSNQAVNILRKQKQIPH